MIRQTFTLSAVLYEAHDRIQAQCLELDITCTAKNRHEIWRSVAEHVEVNMKMAEELGYSIPHAEEKHWKAFRRGSIYYMPRAETLEWHDTQIVLMPNVRSVPCVFSRK